VKWFGERKKVKVGRKFGQKEEKRKGIREKEEEKRKKGKGGKKRARGGSKIKINIQCCFVLALVLARRLCVSSSFLNWTFILLASYPSCEF
jgi:hypothetical protein